MVVRANIRSEAIGGHLATYASSAALYEVGFNHFFRGKDDGGPGDQVYFQGHASPGIYARAFVEGRLTEDQLDHFRFEVGRRRACPSLPPPPPHARLLGVPRPCRWASGPINAIAQAHLARYLDAPRAWPTPRASRVWAFVGRRRVRRARDRSALLGMAGREHLDNLIFVVNCNLQRLDGPVRGNGKVIQEFEATFRGAGWNVIKVIWGSDVGRAAGPRRRRRAARQDEQHASTASSRSTPPSRAPTSASTSSAPTRACAALVEHLTDADLQSLPRGGHDYREALRRLQGGHRARGRAHGHPGQDGQGLDARARDRGPQRHPPDQEDDQGPAAAPCRDRLYLHEEIPETALDADAPPVLPARPRLARRHGYLAERRRALGGPLPSRVVRARPLPSPEPAGFADLLGRLGHARRCRPPWPSPGCCGP